MKILIVSPVGEEVHIRKIPAALARINGTEVTVAAPERVVTAPAYAASGWLTLAGEENRDGFRLLPVALRKPEDPFAGYESEALERLLREARPDVIQVWGAAPAECVAQVVRLKQRVCRKARVVFFGFDQLPYRFAPWTQLRWRYLWSRMAGGIEANSEGVAALRQAGFRKPLERIFWGVALDAFQPMERAAMRRKLGLEYENIVGYVGRFVEEKGLRVLLDALTRLPAGVHAVLVGSGPLQAEIDLRGKSAALAGRVHVFGTRPAAELAEYMNCFDALALPSLTAAHWKEQYGRVIGEAMACGVPVVGSDSGAIPEVIGEAGLIAREGDATALAEALHKALFDKGMRARLIPAGKKRAEEELSVPAMSRRLLEFYGRIAG